jgi:hypothetical protein
MKEHTLEFLNPQYHFGDNVTVRKGYKWVEKAHEGDVVWIVRTGETNPVAKGIIKEMNSHQTIKDCHLEDLWLEHDPECRTPNGLVVAMLRAYPDFTLNDPVTVIKFTIS